MYTFLSGVHFLLDYIQYASKKSCQYRLPFVRFDANRLPISVPFTVPFRFSVLPFRFAVLPFHRFTVPFCRFTVLQPV